MLPMSRSFWVLTLVLGLPRAVAADAPPPRLVTVTGTGEVRVPPDEVVLTVGVDSLDKDISKSRQDHDARVKRVFEAAKKHGLADKDVQSDHIRISPQYRQASSWWERGDFLGYETSQTIALTLHDLSKYEPLLTDLLAAPITRLDSVEWRSSRAREHRVEARRLAVQIARQKAQSLAEALGQSIGAAYSISEEQPDYYGAQVQSNVMREGPAHPEIEGVAPGLLSIAACVTVSFELLPRPADQQR